MARRTVDHIHPPSIVVNTNMDIKVEQWCVIWCCVCRDLTAISMVSGLQDVYQNECLNRRTIMEWHKVFLEEHESTEKLNNSGQLSPVSWKRMSPL